MFVLFPFGHVFVHFLSAAHKIGICAVLDEALQEICTILTVRLETLVEFALSRKVEKYQANRYSERLVQSCRTNKAINPENSSFKHYIWATKTHNTSNFILNKKSIAANDDALKFCLNRFARPTVAALY
jgi:hypothetical protein